MARSGWRCQTSDGRTILGHVREDGGLYLDEDRDLVIDLKTGRPWAWAAPSVAVARWLSKDRWEQGTCSSFTKHATVARF